MKNQATLWKIGTRRPCVSRIGVEFKGRHMYECSIFGKIGLYSKMGENSYFGCVGMPSDPVYKYNIHVSSVGIEDISSSITGGYIVGSDE